MMNFTLMQLRIQTLILKFGYLMNKVSLALGPKISSNEISRPSYICGGPGQLPTLPILKSAPEGPTHQFDNFFWEVLSYSLLMFTLLEQQPIHDF